MWGGKFGTKHSKINGVWNPIVYDKDKYGRNIYLTPVVAQLTTASTDYPADSAEVSYTIEGQTPITTTWGALTEEDGWVEFECPCDGQWKKVKYMAVSGKYKYLKDALHPLNDQLTGAPLQCPTGKPIYENGNALVGYYSDELKSGWLTRAPEKAEITIDNFGKFDFLSYKYSVEQIGGQDVCVSTIIDNDSFSGVPNCNCSSAHGYIWNETDIKMSSLEGDMDIYYSKDAGVKYRVPTNSNNKQIMVARRGLYETTYNNATSTWDITSDEVEDFVDLTTRQQVSGQSYGWVVNDYLSKIDFFVNIVWTIPTVEDGESLNHMTRVKVGTFYIIANWNDSDYTMEDLIYPIESGLNDVYVLERMEKCKATQTFAINTDRNIRSANYKDMPEYSQSELVVFIDPKTMKPYEPNADSFVRRNGNVVGGNLRIIKQHEIYYKWTRSIAPKYASLGHQIVVDAIHFPGTYRLVGETYARSRATGKDERYQFEIPLCKMSSSNSITLEASGDPTTFSMDLKVLRKDDGTMMKLTQYDVECNKYGSDVSGSTKVVPVDMLKNDFNTLD